MGINADDGDVEQAVKSINAPILFIAGGDDKRMPPALAQRLLDAAKHPSKKLVTVPGARHGEAYNTNKEMYLSAVYGFLESPQ